jgi:hypothetical protein
MQCKRSLAAHHPTLQKGLLAQVSQMAMWALAQVVLLALAQLPNRNTIAELESSNNAIK